MNKRITFLKEFVKDAGMVGSVTPSWPALISRMIRPIDFQKAKVIVELGPGTGPITRALLKKMRKDAKLVAFEVNPEFCEGLRKIGDNRLVVIEDSAEHVGKYLRSLGLEDPDYVVSSLPLAVIPLKVRIRILQEVSRILKPGGVYTQFQYSLNAQKFIRKRFPRVVIQFTPFNIPPAFIYICRQPASVSRTHKA